MDHELKQFVIDLGMTLGFNQEIVWLDEEDWEGDEEAIADDYRKAMKRILTRVHELEHVKKVKHIRHSIASKLTIEEVAFLKLNKL